MRKGFTLVELSIVLVIIGLLIGGILVGQSMVETAKITAQIKQFQQIDAAITNFQTKYIYLPGDSPRHNPPGDGDGIVENSVMNATPSTVNTQSAYDYEISYFWPHLQFDGFMTNEYPTFSADASGGLRAGINIPAAKFGDKKTGLAVVTNNNPITAFNMANYEKITTSDYQNNNGNIVPSIPVSQIYAIDAKMDDGLARTGSISLSSYASSCYDASVPPKYVLAGNNKCIADYVIKTSTGNR